MRDVLIGAGWFWVALCGSSCVATPSLGITDAGVTAGDGGVLDGAGPWRPPDIQDTPGLEHSDGQVDSGRGNAGASVGFAASSPPPDGAVASAPSVLSDAAAASPAPESGPIGMGTADASTSRGMAQSAPAASAGALPSTSMARLRPPSRAGELVITEIMIDPKTLSDAAGEWFELHNTTESSFDLQGCAIDDGGKDGRAIEGPFVVGPRQYVTVARQAEPGFTPTHVCPLSLTNTADTLALRCSDIEIDRVAYDKAAGFPVVAGASAALDPAFESAKANDDASAWCAARASYGSDLGTPGAPNAPCSADAFGGSR